MSLTNRETNQYDKAGMKTYKAFQPQIRSLLLSMASNPTGNSYFQNQLAQQQQQSNQIGQRNIENVTQNKKTGGGVLSNSGGYTNAQVARAGIANSLMQSNSFNSALNNALANRSNALSNMSAYQPLQTGTTSTQSGYGTWLPQVAGATANALSPGISSMMTGNSFSSGYRNNTNSNQDSGNSSSSSNYWWNNNGNGNFPY
jgi:hypothetical protein